MDLYDELKQVLIVLDREQVEYALCGGLAVALHGHPRFTEDIDILVLPGDVERVTRLVRECGFTLTTGVMPFGVGTDNAREIHRITKLADEPLCLDLIVVTPGLRDVWEDREVFEWEGATLTAVSAEGLAAMKRAAGRPQDLRDLEMLGFAADAKATNDS